MSMITVLLIGLFLPLFPLSMVFNYWLMRNTHPFFRSVLLLLWPQIGVAIFIWLGETLPLWVLPWAVFTALLYAIRLLTQRDVYSWTGFLATSAWSLLWIPLLAGQPITLATSALSFSIPLTLIVLLAVALERRFGTAYTHLYGGLARIMPRFSGLLVFSMLAATATPVFPTFFIMLKMLVLSSPMITVGVLLIWLIWSWAGVRLLQGLLIGSGQHTQQANDLHRGLSWSVGLILVVLTVAGLYVTGDMS